METCYTILLIKRRKTMKKLIICVLLLVTLPACTNSFRLRFLIENPNRHVPARTFNPTRYAERCVFKDAAGKQLDRVWEQGPLSMAREGYYFVYYKAPRAAVSVCCISSNTIQLRNVPRGPRLAYSCANINPNP